MDKGEINKRLGKTVAFSADEYEPTEKLPTGLHALDSVLGGGFPKGRMTEVYGLEGTGKTTLLLQIIANTKAKTVWIDAEGAWDSDYAKQLGVNLGDVTIVRPDFGEEIIDMIDLLLENGKGIDLIVVDSVPAIVTRAEGEANADQQQMASQARLLSKALRKFIVPLRKSNVVLVFINQLRLNFMGGPYDPYTRPGGKAMRYYTSLQLELKKTGAIKTGDIFAGATIRARTTKSRIAAPFQNTEMTLLYGKGFSAEMSLLDRAVENGIIERKGRSYSFEGKRFATSKNDALAYLEDNADFTQKINDRL